MYKPLSEKAIQDIHAGSLELLGEVGIEVANEKPETFFPVMAPGLVKIIA